MSQEHYITKRRKFKHISEKHRIQICRVTIDVRLKV